MTDYIGREIELNCLTLRVERENAKAMTEGFVKNRDRHYVTVFTAHRQAWSLKNNFAEVPKLLTAKKGKPRREYRLSEIGRSLEADTYRHSARYIAVLDRILHIRNSLGLWDELCTSGIFDIWEPSAPYNSLLTKGGSEKKDPMILVLRIFEIDHEFTNEEIWPEQYFDTIHPRVVRITKPVIDDAAFVDIVGRIKHAARGNVVKEEIGKLGLARQDRG